MGRGAFPTRPITFVVLWVCALFSHDGATRTGRKSDQQKLSFKHSIAKLLGFAALTALPPQLCRLNFYMGIWNMYRVVDDFSDPFRASSMG